MVPILRVARPTDDLEALLPFYRDGLGFSILYRFADHESFDGIILGASGAPYHFEFTSSRGHQAGRAPTLDHLVVFYLPDRDNWDQAVAQMRRTGFHPVARSIHIGTGSG